MEPPSESHHGPPLQVQSVASGQGITLSLHGQLDADSAHLLRPAIAEAFGSTGWAVTFDLDGLSFVDSSGLREFILANRRSQDLGRPMTLLLTEGHPLHSVLVRTGMTTQLVVETKSGADTAPTSRQGRPRPRPPEPTDSTDSTGRTGPSDRA